MHSQGIVKLSKTNEVNPNYFVTLEDYKKITFRKEMRLLQKLVKEFKGKRISFINATPQGGGVAIMRHALIRLYKLLKVDAHWYVLKPNEHAFNITKRKFHNILQNVAQDNIRLTKDEMRFYNNWIGKNAEFFKNVFKNSDVIVIDDSQPSGLISFIKKYNPNAKVIYRSHIQIVSKLVRNKKTPQNISWNFIWNNIKDADCFVAHPIIDFVPENVPKEKTVFMPATTDPLDGLNRELTKKEILYFLRIFNEILIRQEGQKKLDLKRPFIVQIARFDPSKGILDVLESYRKLRLMPGLESPPQLVICGNSSIDDPDGKPVFNEIIKLLKNTEYKKIAEDIKVIRLPHMDDVLNALLRKSTFALQLSTKEGFEVKVTEALMKGKPVIAYKTGGIPLQIKNKINGFLVEVGNTSKVAKHMHDLLTNENLYRKMSKLAKKYANRDYLTVPNAICWLYLANQLTKNGAVVGNYSFVKKRAEREYVLK